jgi:acyl-CoA-dependent ceramide synthase
MRHVVNLSILWAVLTEFRTVGPYELNWETQQYKCWISQVITFALLASLQAVNLFWLFLILRIAKNYVFNDVVKDERSDYEDDEEIEGLNTQTTNGSTALPNGRDQVKRRNVGKDTHAPQVLVNGKPVDVAAANGKKV